jgi:thiamine-monophosphate kinase
MSEKDGEEYLIDCFQKMQGQHLLKPPLGIGDDASCIPLSFFSHDTCVVSKDLLVEGTHFRRSYHPPYWLGQKIVEVNLSDMAAMGAYPKGVFFGLGLPHYFFQGTRKKQDQYWFKRLCAGMKKALGPIPLLGGDTVRSENILFDLTIFGEQKKQNLKTRMGLEVGDHLCVTDPLGGSLMGFQLLEKHFSSVQGHDQWKSLFAQQPRAYQQAIRHHLNPKSKVQEGLFFSQQKSVVALMDISDGLYEDLKKLAQLNKKKFQIEMDQIPLHRALTSGHQPSHEMAFCSGEEYSLIVVVKKNQFHQLNQLFMQSFKRPLVCIGEVIEQVGTSSKSSSHYRWNKKSYQPSLKGFQHFSSSL